MSEEAHMQIPVPKRGAFEWNLNTVMMVVGFAFTWGVTYQVLEGGREANAKDIKRLEERIAAVETTGRILDNHELRISNVEVSSRDASAALRAVETSINSLASDMRLTREILERLERGQGNRRPP